MATPLKDYYNEAFLTIYAQALKNVCPSFDLKSFYIQVFSDNWNDLELKQRMRKISESLASFLPQNYLDSIQILMNTND